MKFKVYNFKFNSKRKLPVVTVHGRFQPPLHINHWNYVSPAFDLADKVTILITNPNLDESDVKETNHRNKKENNPFTYEQRVKIFQKFFEAMRIPAKRYEFKPFKITSDADWDKILSKAVPNLVNTYGPWSRAKLEKFKVLGYKVIHSDKHKIIDVSGKNIRKILSRLLPQAELKKKLVKAGYMKEAIDGLFKVLKKKR